MQTPNEDLDAALAFVIERMSQEAALSNSPLDDDEMHFLNHLPTEPTNLTASWGFQSASADSWPTPVLRDFRFERLCKLAKLARVHDVQTSPDTAREWEFATAVLALHRHPMSWLLSWAGIRTGERPRWDGLLLLTTAVLVVALFVVGLLALSFLTDGQKDIWKWTFWIFGACVYCTLITLLYFAMRRIEVRRQIRNIENFRRNLPARAFADSHH